MKRTSTRLIALGAIAGLVTLSACGSDSNDSSSDTNAPESTEAMAETTEAMTETSDAMAEEPGNIVEVAVGAGSFNTLVAAVQAAGLDGTLADGGPFTVFAPTDDAFAALPDGLVDCLLLPESSDALTAILTYHVVDGTVLSTDLEEVAVPTLQGENIEIGLTDGVTLNASVNVAAADVLASNGVIHVIDGVLVPPSIDVEAFLASCPA
jgi:uncharacterized surface protein with fasciclin (FAS1) repeats